MCVWVVEPDKPAIPGAAVTVSITIKDGTVFNRGFDEKI